MPQTTPNIMTLTIITFKKNCCFKIMQNIIVTKADVLHVAMLNIVAPCKLRLNVVSKLHHQMAVILKEKRLLCTQGTLN
jgi:hypothetical protein